METNQFKLFKLGREPRDGFGRKIKEWEEKNVLVTLTREEREEEYQKALIELQDTMKEFVEINYPYASESTKDSVMDKQELSLLYFIETEEEREQRYKEASEKMDIRAGRKTPIFQG